MASCFVKLFPPSPRAALAVLAVALLSTGCQQDPSLGRAETLHDQGVNHYWDSAYHLGIEPLTTAFELRRTHLGPVDPLTIDTAKFLLACLDNNGDDRKAYDLAKDYLVEIEHLVGRESLEYADIESLFGTVQAELGETEEAIKALRHAKEVYVTVKGERNEDSFLSMHNLNLILAQSGHTEEAIAGEERLLELRKEVLGLKHRETIKSMTNLAFALSKRGDSERARDLHEESLELRKEVFGKDHPETYVEVVNVAVSYSRLGDHEKAIEYAREGFEFFKANYPEGHPDIRWSALNLRNILSFEGHEEERARLTEDYNLD